MAGVNLHKHWNERFAFSYVIPNLYNYLLNPVLINSNIPLPSYSKWKLINGSGDGSHSRFLSDATRHGPVLERTFCRLCACAPQGSGNGLAREEAGMTARQEQRRSVRGLDRIDPGFVCSDHSWFPAAVFLGRDALPGKLYASPDPVERHRVLAGLRADLRPGIWRRLYCGFGIVLAAASIIVSTLGTISVLMLRFSAASLFPFLK